MNKIFVLLITFDKHDHYSHENLLQTKKRKHSMLTFSTTINHLLDYDRSSIA